MLMGRSKTLRQMQGVLAGFAWAGIAVTAMIGERAAAQPCEPAWTPGLFERPGMFGTRVYALAAYQSAGPEGRGMLYAGGAFSQAGAVSAWNVAGWNGTQWSALGSGTGYTVYALTLFDDGTGTALYAGGEFSLAGGVPANHIAKWDGTQWWSMGSGLNAKVHALAVFNDGTGPALYAGGQFTSAGGTTANRIAKWDGTEWGALGDGMNGYVYALVVFDDGTGPALYAGGQFPSAGGATANRIAKWDGTQWSALGNGLNDDVSALAVYDPPGAAGPELYAGGSFTRAGDVPANGIARWNGVQWSAAGGAYGHTVRALATFDDGNGPVLYAGGGFGNYCLATWDGTQWSEMQDGPNDTVRALAVFDDGSGSALYVGGDFTSANDVPAYLLAKWDGTAWSPVARGVNGSWVRAMRVFEEDGRAMLYTDGYWRVEGGLSLNKIVRWDGRQWWPLPGGMNRTNMGVNALEYFDDGSGRSLYAGGDFSTASGVPVNGIAKLDGTVWSALDGGMGGVSEPWIAAMTVFDPPDASTGSGLYVGGEFTTAGGVPANNVARWDGSGWSALGEGTDGPIYALTVFDDGSGPALYAGGSFTAAGAAPANRIARWDGTGWSAMSGGLTGSEPNTCVYALAASEGNSGPVLCVGGEFTAAGSVPANRIANWNGTQWSALGGGLDNDVRALAVVDVGAGPALYAGGLFSNAGGASAKYIAKWDGGQWSPLDTGTNMAVYGLTGYDDGSGPALYAGGFLWAAGSSAVVWSFHVARWGPQTAHADLECDQDVDGFDFLTFANCFNGPGKSPLAACENGRADLDDDGDVDGEDFLTFANCYNGSDRAPNCP